MDWPPMRSWMRQPEDVFLGSGTCMISAPFTGFSGKAHGRPDAGADGRKNQADQTAGRRKLTAEERKNKMPDLGWDQALLTEGGEGTSKVQLSLDNPEGFAEAITQWDADGRRKTDFILGSTGEGCKDLERLRAMYICAARKSRQFSSSIRKCR